MATRTKVLLIIAVITVGFLTLGVIFLQKLYIPHTHSPSTGHTTTQTITPHNEPVLVETRQGLFTPEQLRANGGQKLYEIMYPLVKGYRRATPIADITPALQIVKFPPIAIDYRYGGVSFSFTATPYYYPTMEMLTIEVPEVFRSALLNYYYNKPLDYNISSHLGQISLSPVKPNQTVDLWGQKYKVEYQVKHSVSLTGGCNDTKMYPFTEYFKNSWLWIDNRGRFEILLADGMYVVGYPTTTDENTPMLSMYVCEYNPLTQPPRFPIFRGQGNKVVLGLPANLFNLYPKKLAIRIAKGDVLICSDKPVYIKYEVKNGKIYTIHKATTLAIQTLYRKHQNLKKTLEQVNREIWGDTDIILP